MSGTQMLVFGGHQKLSNWINGSINTREIMPGIGNQDCFPGLEIIDLRRESPTATLLDQSNSLLHSKSYTNREM